MADDLNLSQDLEAAYAAYTRRHGRIRGMAWLRHAILRDIEAQRVLDAASEQFNGDTHWRRLGEAARAEAADALALADAMGKAAE
jgi:hypothetical protein